MVKPASGACNMRCAYCFYADEVARRERGLRPRMDAKTLECLVREIFGAADGYCSIAFQGGEPTLSGTAFYREFLRLERRYNTRRVPVHHAFQTNGLLLDKDWCDLFREGKFLVGVSLDGTETTHDGHRRDASGGPTYARVLTGIELLRASGVEFNILTVVNRLTAPAVREIYEDYRARGFRWQQYIPCLDPLGEVPGSRGPSISPEEYGRFLVELFNLWHADWMLGRAPVLRQFENYFGVLLGYAPESCDHRGVCGRQFVVESDGSVYPCDFYCLDEWFLGNIRKRTFAQLAARSAELGFERSSFDHAERCRACRYFQICRGGCRRLRGLPGLEAGMNYYCRGFEMFFDACLPRMRAMAAGAALRGPGG